MGTARRMWPGLVASSVGSRHGGAVGGEGGGVGGRGGKIAGGSGGRLGGSAGGDASHDWKMGAACSAMRKTSSTTRRMKPSAIMLVNLSASTRRRNVSGATASAASSVQNWRCSRRPLPPSASSARGIESPTTIRYDVATPKHLTAMARSITSPAPGHAASATV